ncbi:MAG: hypothetical protein ACRDWI_07660 [Jiangellaceae bacterium]
MGSSGLIYAAIVAAWAAVLVPRWVRRHEEVDDARELDAARGVRVVPRSAATSRGRHPVVDLPPADVGPMAVAEPDRGLGESFAVAARRRRRVLMMLAAILAVLGAGAAAGRLPGFAVTVPATMLAIFLALARRAAVAQARRRSVAQRRMAFAAVDERPRGRIAVLDEPEPLPAADPDAWEPVPVPRPTYMSKARAEPPAVRTIDLSSAGAWTSGRLNPADSIVLPPQRRTPEPSDDEAAELPEHRRAVGD